MLYKYYSDKSDYALANFRDNHISFTSIQILNDPFEGVGEYIYSVSDEAAQYWKKEQMYPNCFLNDFQMKFRRLLIFVIGFSVVLKDMITYLCGHIMQMSVVDFVLVIVKRMYLKFQIG